MSVNEIVYRINQHVKKIYSSKYVTNDIPELEKYSFQCDLEIFKKYSFFGYLYDKDKIRWNYDISNKKEFDENLSSFKINILDKNGPNAKIVWEINRHQYLVEYALKYKNTGEKKYLDTIFYFILDWTENNPYMKGVNWYSNIEVNIRLINWYVVWEILKLKELKEKDKEVGRFCKDVWEPLIHLHCYHSYKFPSKYSSANNHLISEVAGLFIAATYWKFKESAWWVKYSKSILEKEIIKQHSPNGINKEEAAEYIQFITDFFLYAYVVGKKTNNEFSDKYKEALYKILEYINNFLDTAGNFPKYGDEDDGKVVDWNLENGINNFQSLLVSGAIIYNEDKFVNKKHHFDVKNGFLFGETGEKKYSNINCINDGDSSKFYTEEGHFIFKNTFNNKEIYLHYDVAALGYLSIAAHGHADALSFLLSVDGAPVFIDSGTYVYHSEPEWRKYFIGTLAHNTIRIDEKDQAENGGPTLWLNHFKTKVMHVEQNKEYEFVSGSHNGYEKIGVEHARSIKYLKNEGRILIEDTIETNGSSHSIEVPFHLHPDIKIERNNTNCEFILSNEKAKLKLTIDNLLSPRVMFGSKEPILGWYSPSFYKKIPTSVIYSKCGINKSVKLNYEIQIME